MNLAHLAITSLATSQNYTIDIESEGRLILPEEVRQKLNLKSGDRLILTVQKDGTMQLVSLKQQVKKLRGLLKNKSPQISLVDELIQERRQEAENE